MANSILELRDKEKKAYLKLKNSLMCSYSIRTALNLTESGVYYNYKYYGLAIDILLNKLRYIATNHPTFKRVENAVLQKTMTIEDSDKILRNTKLKDSTITLGEIKLI